MQLKIEKLRKGDVLDAPRHPSRLSQTESVSIVIEAIRRRKTNVPLDRAVEVGHVRTGRKYIYLTMGTWAVVRRPIGTLVSVAVRVPEASLEGSGDVAGDRPAAEGFRGGDPVSIIRDAAEAALEAAEYADKPADFVSEGGQAFRNGQRPVPFNYVRSQFAHVEDNSEFYRIQVRSDARDAHTKWMNISPAQFAAIREILAEGESAPQCQHVLYECGACGEQCNIEE